MITKNFIKNCKICDKEILRKDEFESDYHYRRRNFCSKKCRYSINSIYLKKDYEIKYCKICGKEIKKNKNVSVKNYYKRQTCNNECKFKYQSIKKSIKTKCSYCGKIIKKKNSQYCKNTNNFCNKKCIDNYRKENKKDKYILKKCDYCGKKAKKYIHDIDRTKKTFCSRKCMGKWQSKNCIGKNSYSWKGGVTTLYHKIRTSSKNKKWIQQVFKRDKYTCQNCNDSTGGNLNAHHIKYFSIILKENNITNLRKAKKCKELWDIDNGITLCEDCHIKLHKEIGYN